MLWGLKPLEQQAAYGLAVAYLKKQVHIGLVLPGERLPAERKLAEQIGISRVTLREALRVLETGGYISIKRGATGGAFVANENELRTMATLHIASDQTSVMRIFEYRVNVEPLAAKFACLRRTPGDIRQIEAALNEIKQAKSAGELRRGEAAFHLAIALASANPYISNSIEDALASLFMPLTQGNAIKQAEQSHLLRSRVFEAIVERDEKLADSRMLLVIEHEQSRLADARAA